MIALVAISLARGSPLELFYWRALVPYSGSYRRSFHEFRRQTIDRAVVVASTRLTGGTTGAAVGESNGTRDDDDYFNVLEGF